MKEKKNEQKTGKQQPDKHQPYQKMQTRDDQALPHEEIQMDKIEFLSPLLASLGIV